MEIDLQRDSNSFAGEATLFSSVQFVRFQCNVDTDVGGIGSNAVSGARANALNARCEETPRQCREEKERGRREDGERCLAARRGTERHETA